MNITFHAHENVSWMSVVMKLYLYTIDRTTRRKKLLFKNIQNSGEVKAVTINEITTFCSCPNNVHLMVLLGANCDNFNIIHLCDSSDTWVSL